MKFSLGRLAISDLQGVLEGLDRRQSVSTLERAFDSNPAVAACGEVATVDWKNQRKRGLYL
jgi:hypothetical protein